MINQKKAYIYAGTAVFFWSTVASAFKIALQFLDVLNLLLYSILTTVVVLFVILALQNKLKDIFSFSYKSYLTSALLGFINPFVYYIVLFKAYSLLPAQVAQPLNMVWPIVLVFFSIIFLKQKISLVNIIALFICCVGVFFISSQGNVSGFKLSSPFGVFLALSCSIVWSLFWVFNVKDKRDEVVKLFLNFVFALVFILLTLLLFFKIEIPVCKGLISAIYVGIFEMGITFVLWLKAMKLSKTNDKIGSLVFLAPFISLIFIHYIVGEQIFYTTIIGLVLIVFGIFIQQIKREKHEKN